jgi:excisionase family DNA binding protein
VQISSDLESGPALLTFNEVGRHLGVSLSQVQRLVRAGDLPVVTIGRRNTRIRRADLLEYIENLTPRPTP